MRLCSSNSSFPFARNMMVFWNRCFVTQNHINVHSMLMIFKLLLLPVLLYILHQGCQQWRAQQLLPTTLLMNLNGIQTYHSVILQLFSILETLVYFSGTISHGVDLVLESMIFKSVTSFGQDFTNLTVCVLHCMAVVHPAHYLALKQRSRARTCTNLIAWMGVSVHGIVVLCWVFFSFEHSAFQAGFMGLLTLVVAYCCIAVLCALKRPRPGVVGGDQERHSQ